MAPKYVIGQKVIIMPTSNQGVSPRDADIVQYAGQSGEIIDYYWISLDRGIKVFYIYTVRIGDDDKEIVVHEDELKEYI